MQLPGNARNLVRDAIRNHPKVGEGLALYAPGTKVNSLTKDQLLTVANLLQIDVRAIVASATGIGQHIQAAINDMDAELDGDAEDTSDDLAAEASTLRKELSRAMIEGDFDTVTARIEDLLKQARKAPEKIIETIYVDAKAGDNVPTISVRPVPVPAPIRVDTWSNLFNLKSARVASKINVYPATAGTPSVDPHYRWPEQATIAILSAMGRGRNVWLYGPAGTGKTTWPTQVCARTGRPFALVACDDTTEAPELVGMTVPHQGGVRWQDGVLTAAMRVPHTIILIDEPTVARAGALMVLQSVLASGMLSIKETGEVVRCAEGVRFIVADNTNGTGGGTAEGYEGTRRMNRAMLDRFAAFVKFDYLPAHEEAEAIVSHTGCTPQLAAILVECAQLTRKARVTHALGLRRLIAWAEALTDGLDARSAFEYAILNSCARDDREPIEQACALGLDNTAVARAVSGKPPSTFNRGIPPAADFAG